MNDLSGLCIPRLLPDCRQSARDVLGADDSKDPSIQKSAGWVSKGIIGAEHNGVGRHSGHVVVRNLVRVKTRRNDPIRRISVPLMKPPKRFSCANRWIIAD